MTFIKLEERVEEGTNEYYLRPDLIREVDVERDEQGRIRALDVYLMEGEHPADEEPAFTFEDETADRAYTALHSFLAGI